MGPQSLWLSSPCLSANSYVEARCQAVLRELRQCCARLPRGRSLVCSGFEREEEEKLAPQPLRSEGLREVISTPRPPGRFCFSPTLAGSG
ncbi:Cx9C motif-containing protein 4 [Galemys pyrenaicus]|uniref:Cx9C motif-containing protein 4 n=1 Tax=Galemys pyrenaicus TaxID=202257 RepID=A0A8J6DUQ6_GALPY|nr:Cx9C motif-containing protein 4 [Galemys pyrenaicus]